MKELEGSHSKLTSENDSLRKEHSTLKSSHDKLSTQHDERKVAHESDSAELKKTKESLETSNAELEKTKAALSAAVKRGEAAEKKRDALQTENADLIAQLGEVRGKVVEVTEEKAGYVAAIDSWETKSKAWEKRKSELEEQLAASTVSLNGVMVADNRRKRSNSRNSKSK